MPLTVKMRSPLKAGKMTDDADRNPSLLLAGKWGRWHPAEAPEDAAQATCIYRRVAYNSLAKEHDEEESSSGMHNPWCIHEGVFLSKDSIYYISLWSEAAT